MICEDCRIIGSHGREGRACALFNEHSPIAQNTPVRRSHPVQQRFGDRYNRHGQFSAQRGQNLALSKRPACINKDPACLY